MNNIKKEMRRIENQQNANRSLAELNNTVKSIDALINDFYKDAKNELLNNNEEGFELIANSIFYFQDIRKMVETIRIQYQTYVKTATLMESVEGIRPILKNTAKTMNSMPSFAKNSKDFAKFRKSLLKGQLNMQAISSMMGSVNPAISTTKSKEDFAALRQRLMTDTDSNINVQNTKLENNDDFFDAINKD